MRKVLALLRASWLEARSYRVKMVLSLVGLLGAAVPLYYLAMGLQSTVQDSIADQGGHFFSFLVIGALTFAFVRTSISSLPGAVGGAIGNGTLEALLGTPTGLWTLLLGMVSYSFVWTAIRCSVFLALAWVLGAQLPLFRAPLALAILAIIVVVHFTFSIIAAALIMAFRAAGPLESGVIWLSTILGGVYYPTSAIPSWLEWASDFIPLTYGLRALRRALLEEEIPFAVIGQDVLVLAAMGGVLLAVSLFAFSLSLRYARRAGTLAQY